MDIREDAPRLLAQLERIVAHQPPPASIRAFYYGLFERQIDAVGRSQPALHILGLIHTLDELDWAAWDEDSWLPEGRYFALPALAAQDPAEWEALEEAVATLLRENRTKIDALLCPGGPRPIAVGWDAGEPRLL